MVGSIDHPLHPLGLVTAHGLVGGDGPVSWQQAGVALAFGCIVLLVIPLYLLTREAFGDGTAWLGCLLVTANPLFGSILANVLSESSFLLCWTWGLWAAIRFLRAAILLAATDDHLRSARLSVSSGRASLAAGDGADAEPLATASRHANRLAAMGSAAVVFLLLGSLALAGPYMVLKGGVGTKPAVARVLGPGSERHPLALEREQPLAPRPNHDANLPCGDRANDQGRPRGRDPRRSSPWPCWGWS